MLSGVVEELAVSVILWVRSSGASTEAFEISLLVVVAALGINGNMGGFDSVLRREDGVGGGDVSMGSLEELDESGRLSDSSETKVSMEDKLALAAMTRPWGCIREEVKTTEVWQKRWRFP
jgi:hypothetical protein